jgi:hypothetical protein
MTSFISAGMAGAVGRTISRRKSFPVAESDIRRWAIAVYWPDPPPRLFWDADYAAGTRHGGIVAPQEFNPFAWMPAESEAVPVTDDAERIERVLGVEGPGLMFELNGGRAAEYGGRIRPGDVITAVSRLAGYSEKTGRLGPMLFTVTEETWTNQIGALVVRSQMTSIRY